MEKKAGVLERLRNLIRMNVNAALDDAEDPTKALNLIVEDMRSEIHTAKKQVAEAIAQEKLVQRKVEDAEKAVASWQERAENAVRAGDDEFGREALNNKARAQAQLDLVAPQWNGLKSGNGELKEELRAMQERYEDVVQKKDVLIAKAKMAEARSTAAAAAPTVFSDQSQAMLDRAEEQIRSMEAKAEADREVARIQTTTAEAMNELDRKGKEIDVDSELAKLKKKIAEGPDD